jgi:anti-sigma-K factor RskA
MEDEPTEHSWPRWAKALLLVALMIVLAAIAAPNFMRVRRSGPHKSCIANLKQIDACKEQWALENRLTNGTRLTPADITGVLSYWKNSAMPVCPQGGVYTFRKIGENPRCTVPGHTL